VPVYQLLHCREEGWVREVVVNPIKHSYTTVRDEVDMSTIIHDSPQAFISATSFIAFHYTRVLTYGAMFARARK
jgi:hypothetical protein